MLQSARWLYPGVAELRAVAVEGASSVHFSQFGLQLSIAQAHIPAGCGGRKGGRGGEEGGGGEGRKGGRGGEGEGRGRGIQSNFSEFTFGGRRA